MATFAPKLYIKNGMNYHNQFTNIELIPVVTKGQNEHLLWLHKSFWQESSHVIK